MISNNAALKKSEFGNIKPKIKPIKQIITNVFNWTTNSKHWQACLQIQIVIKLGRWLNHYTLLKKQDTSVLFYQWNYCFTFLRDLISVNSSNFSMVCNKKATLCFSYHLSYITCTYNMYRRSLLQSYLHSKVF